MGLKMIPRLSDLEEHVIAMDIESVRAISSIRTGMNCNDEEILPIGVDDEETARSICNQIGVHIRFKSEEIENDIPDTQDG